MAPVAALIYEPCLYPGSMRCAGGGLALAATRHSAGEVAVRLETTRTDLEAKRRSIEASYSGCVRDASYDEAIKDHAEAVVRD